MSETPAVLAKRMLKELSLPPKLSTKATVEEFVEVLRACAENRAMKDMNKMLDWIVNKRLPLMLMSILSLDRSLFNKLFDPTWNSKKKSTNIVTKAAIDGLDKFIYKKMTGPSVDIYTLPVILEMSKEDYDKIVSFHFNPTDYNARFIVGCGMVQDFFEVQHIPKLLQMLEYCFDPKFFSYAWNLVDEKHWKMVAEFIWEKLFDGKVARRCGKLEVSNLIQLKIAEFVVEKSSSRLVEYQKGKLKKIDELSKCMFMTYFSSEIKENHPEEIQEITKVQQDAARVMLNHALEKNKENPILMEHFEIMFRNADKSFQFEMIDIAIDIEDPGKSRELLRQLFNFLPSSSCLPAHVKIIKSPSAMYSDSDLDILLYRLSRDVDYRDLSVEEASYLLSLLIEYNRLDVFFLDWLDSECPLEVRKGEAEITAWCLRRKEGHLVVKVVREMLSKQSQQEFLPIFLDQLQAGRLLHGLYSFGTDDAEFLVAVKEVIQKHLSRPFDCKSIEGLGGLVACYGDQSDLENGLKLKQPEFVTGLLINEMNKILQEITPNISELILEKSKECVMAYSSSNHPSGMRRYEWLDFHRTYLFRNKIFDQAIIKSAENCNQESVICSEFELLIAKNNTINKKQISRYVKSRRFSELKIRFIQVWDKFAEEAKELICEIRPSFNSLHRPFSDPRFREAVLAIGNGNCALPAFQTVKAYSNLCVTKVELTAHWFYVKQFEREIETGGYLGMFEVAYQNIV
jgi:hypothetical protein